MGKLGCFNVQFHSTMIPQSNTVQQHYHAPESSEGCRGDQAPERCSNGDPIRVKCIFDQEAFQYVINPPASVATEEPLPLPRLTSLKRELNSLCFFRLKLLTRVDGDWRAFTALQTTFGGRTGLVEYRILFFLSFLWVSPRHSLLTRRYAYTMLHN